MQFKDVCGQEKVKANLLTSAKNNRIHHTQLFLGKIGFGGLPLALALSQYVNCLAPTDHDSCGSCSNCQKNSNLIHPNVHFTYPTITKKSGHKPVSTDFITEWRNEVLNNPYLSSYQWMQGIQAENKLGNITAAECRRILDFFKLKALDGGQRVLVVWNAESLSKEGNILLKFLEEPPENTIIILLAENEEKVLNTIRSRCQILRLPSLVDSEISSYLEQKAGYATELAESVSKLADGDLNLALSIQTNEEGELEGIFKNWMKAISTDKVGLVKTVEGMSRLGRDKLKLLFDYGIVILREALLIQHSASSSRLNEGEEKMAKWMAHKMTIEALHDTIVEFDGYPYKIERNANAKIQLMTLSVFIDTQLQSKSKTTIAQTS